MIGADNPPVNTESPQLPGLPVPDLAASQVVVPAPGAGRGNWAGAPSAVLDPRDDSAFWLAYRMRRPLAEGRGVAVELAHYSEGRLTVVDRVERGLLGAESLERPALVRRPGGGWRLYLSAATPGSKHWWIEAVDADEVSELPKGRRTMVFPGSADLAVKDPVISVDDDGWHAWVCCHPLTEPGAEDRMWTAYSHSDDGLAWSEPVPVLRPDGSGWDARGRRVTAALRTPGDGLAVYYDGRATAEENWYERTGLAFAPAGSGPAAALTVPGDSPVAQSPVGTHALRYVSLVPLPQNGFRLFFEASRPDGAHDLMTYTP